ncbi:MAG: SMP-30/gluconolactonase/LRE family protein [Gammaproteobacteria bacterium]|nr:SMP-30/gluconolactonase/LRE family protein [Gammaproteobacteria bacterium]NNL49476.1 SMP-30/gluconolactonase/LRE family protein [Woeseiaceae bacterium]
MQAHAVVRPRSFLLLILAAAVLYLLTWPVPIEPVAWNAPADAGYSGDFALNDALVDLRAIDISPHHGPEDIVADEAGNLYTGTDNGKIIRIGISGAIHEFAETGGRPLGLEFDSVGNLLVANGTLGVQRIDATGKVTLLTNEVGGMPIGYADDLDIASDGRVYFSDASTKFGAGDYGGSYEASLLDIMEHGGHGRVLVYDPANAKTETLLDGLQFANGIAVDPQGRFLLVNETSNYRVLRHWLGGARAGETEVLVDNLPGFPDNINRGLDGRYWVGLVAPRNALLDALSDKPFLRKVVQRLPKALRPQAVASTHVIAINEDGNVVANLHGDGSSVNTITGALETPNALYLSSLVGTAIGRHQN